MPKGLLDDPRAAYNEAIGGFAAETMSPSGGYTWSDRTIDRAARRAQALDDEVMGQYDLARLQELIRQYGPRLGVTMSYLPSSDRAYEVGRRYGDRAVNALDYGFEPFSDRVLQGIKEGGILGLPSTIRGLGVSAYKGLLER